MDSLWLSTSPKAPVVKRHVYVKSSSSFNDSYSTSCDADVKLPAGGGGQRPAGGPRLWLNSFHQKNFETFPSSADEKSASFFVNAEGKDELQGLYDDFTKAPRLRPERGFRTRSCQCDGVGCSKCRVFTSSTNLKLEKETEAKEAFLKKTYNRSLPMGAEPKSAMMTFGRSTFEKLPATRKAVSFYSDLSGDAYNNHSA